MHENIPEINAVAALLTGNAWLCNGKKRSFAYQVSDQGLTNPLHGCPGQVKIFARQVKKFLTCPEKCLNYIGKTKEFQDVLAEAVCRTRRSDFDLSSPVNNQQVI